MRRTSRNWIAIALTAVLASLMLTPAAEAVGPSQTATSTGGMWLDGSAGSDSNIPGYGVDRDFGGLVAYRVTYVDPGLVLNGDGPSGNGDADLRKPWVSIVETHALPPENGSTGWLRDVRDLCNSFVNPADSGREINSAHDRIRVWADVPCDDGRGYDFYRVTWEGDIWQNYATSLYDWHPDAGWGWGSSEDDGWSGSLSVLKSGLSTRTLWVHMRICGHPGTEADCTDGWIAWGRLDAGAILTTASRDNTGTRVPVFGSDPIVGGNPSG